MTKKAEHAIEFALYCTGWYFVQNDNFEEGHCWQNARQGWTPIHGPLLRLTSEQLYKRFLKESKV